VVSHIVVVEVAEAAAYRRHLQYSTMLAHLGDSVTLINILKVLVASMGTLLRNFFLPAPPHFSNPFHQQDIGFHRMGLLYLFVVVSSVHRWYSTMLAHRSGLLDLQHIEHVQQRFWLDVLSLLFSQQLLLQPYFSPLFPNGDPCCRLFDLLHLPYCSLHRVATSQQMDHLFGFQP
jgi:hypothetical protein